MTADLEAAHKASIFHRALVEQSSLCGCFHCLARFDPARITEWTDTSKPQVEQTAICPECGIDAVLPEAAGHPLEPAFLLQMQARWFGVSEEE